MKKTSPNPQPTMVQTYLEFPAETLPRANFRQLIRHIRSHKGHEHWFCGHEGRKLIFQFESEQKCEDFLKEFQEMLQRRGIRSEKA